MLIPCIDLQRGQAVQLVQGRKRELAVADALGLLEKFKEYQWLHVIDLDAAMGTGENNALVERLCAAAIKGYGMKVRVGGGIRSVPRASKLAELGVDQLIIGSAAFQRGRVNALFLRRLLKKVKRQKIVVALDTMQSFITIHGWRRKLRLRAEDVIRSLEPFCAGFLCTDVDREGTMSGVNLEWFRMLRRATQYPIIAAGGIKTRREVSALEKIGIDAAVGMAMYKGRVR
jgi:phosphoribosylformimino-5-aminoimidazole carboxamide ribotide isomerase